MTVAEKAFWTVALESLKAVARLLPKVIKALEDWLSECESLKKPA